MSVQQTIARAAAFRARLAVCFRDDPWLLIRFVGWRLVLPVLKRTVPVRTLAAWMAPEPASVDTAIRERRIATVRRFLSQGGRLVISGNCLERSLVLYRCLREVNAPARLVMGVAREGATVDGHAWVEIDGEPMADSTTGRFVPVMTFGAGGAVQSFKGQCEHA